MKLQVGCLTRPWHAYTLDESLPGIAAAGFPTVGVMLSEKGQPLITPENEKAAIARVNDLVAKHKLIHQVTITNTDTDVPEAEAVAKLKRTLGWCKQLGLTHLILTGTHNESKYDAWYQATAKVLDYAQQQGVFVMLKAHGGISARAEDLLKAKERLNHPNFGLCYDPGNIYYYTGEKAEDDLPKVAAHVSAMCIKDETGGYHGEVMLTPGTGLVDFPRIFTILRDSGFSGPCWVECVGGTTLQELNAEATKTYRFITDVLAAV